MSTKEVIGSHHPWSLGLSSYWQPLLCVTLLLAWMPGFNFSWVIHKVIRSHYLQLLVSSLVQPPLPSLCRQRSISTLLRRRLLPLPHNYSLVTASLSQQESFHIPCEPFALPINFHSWWWRKITLYLPQSFKNWVWLLFILSLIAPGMTLLQSHLFWQIRKCYVSIIKVQVLSTRMWNHLS